MLIVGSLLSTVLLVVFAEARVMWVAYATMCIVSYGFVLCFATSNTLMQLNVPDALRGRVMSIYTLMFIGTMPFGSLFAGWLATFIGAPKTIPFVRLSLARDYARRRVPARRPARYQNGSAQAGID